MWSYISTLLGQLWKLISSVDIFYLNTFLRAWESDKCTLYCFFVFSKRPNVPIVEFSGLTHGMAHRVPLIGLVYAQSQIMTQNFHVRQTFMNSSLLLEIIFVKLIPMLYKFVYSHSNSWLWLTFKNVFSPYSFILFFVCCYQYVCVAVHNVRIPSEELVRVLTHHNVLQSLPVPPLSSLPLVITFCLKIFISLLCIISLYFSFYLYFGLLK